MKLHRKTFVAGGVSTPFIGKFHPDFIWKGHADFGKRENPSLEGHITNVTQQLFTQLGIDGTHVDKAFIGNFAGELFSNQGHLGAALAGAHPTLNNKPITRTEGACASGGLGVVGGIDAIQAGYDVVLCVGAEVQNTVNAKVGADYLARASHYATQRSIDEFTFPALFARRAKFLRQEWGITEEDLADVVVKAYNNANKNPLAHMRTVKMDRNAAMSSPLFLENPELKDYLRVSHCSQVSDGGSALLLVSEEGMKKLGLRRDDATQVLGYGHATGSLYDQTDPTELSTTRAAAERAYAAAGVNPGQVGVCEVHDCFAITEVLMYEALGFADKSRGIHLVRNGDVHLDGRIPVNTGGGLMAFGHPVGATGVKQLLEVHKQLKGNAGGYQVKNGATVGLTANMGGDDRTAVVTVLGA